MDLDAILKRKPTVVLVDEFAHTNSPGSKNQKRYEDVLELLEAGISVITTLNVQHLESLYNVIEAATGIKVKERIPDSIVAQADQIMNIDLPAEDLIERLKAGKIYPLDRVEPAMGNFFTESNLTRLREITFSEVANFLDRRQRLLTPDEQQAQLHGEGDGGHQQPRTPPRDAVTQDCAAGQPAQRAMVCRLCPDEQGSPRQNPRGNPPPPYRYAGDRAENGRYCPHPKEQRHRQRP